MIARARAPQAPQAQQAPQEHQTRAHRPFSLKMPPPSRKPDSDPGPAVAIWALRFVIRRYVSSSSTIHWPLLAADDPIELKMK